MALNPGVIWWRADVDHQVIGQGKRREATIDQSNQRDEPTSQSVLVFVSDLVLVELARATTAASPDVVVDANEIRAVRAVRIVRPPLGQPPPPTTTTMTAAAAAAALKLFVPEGGKDGVRLR